MPLKIEIHIKEIGWRLVSILKPGDPPGSLSDIKSGNREIYIFECASSDSYSLIQRSKFGIDEEIGIARWVYTKGFETIKELRKDDEPFELEIKTQISSKPRLLRFTHI